MSELFEQWAEYVALGVEGAAALLIAIGALEALWLAIPPWVRRQSTIGHKKNAWLHFARWLILALEFELAADVIRSAISPTWDDVGQLAAIAVIRTFLNYFLEQDLEHAAELGRPVRPAEVTLALRTPATDGQREDVARTPAGAL